MEYNILENGWYQLSFTVEADGNVYRDALVITPEEYNVLTLESFEEIQQQRYSNWKTIHDTMVAEGFDTSTFVIPPSVKEQANG